MIGKHNQYLNVNDFGSINLNPLKKVNAKSKREQNEKGKCAIERVVQK